MDIGKQIKNAREEKGLRQVDLAKLVDLSRKQIERIEKGQGTRVGTLKRIAKVLRKKLVIRLDENI